MSDAEQHPTDEQAADEQAPDDRTAGEQDVERQRAADPDAPGLGAFDEGGEDAPEPNEPG